MSFVTLRKVASDSDLQRSETSDLQRSPVKSRIQIKVTQNVFMGSVQFSMLYKVLANFRASA